MNPYTPRGFVRFAVAVLVVIAAGRLLIAKVPAAQPLAQLLGW